MKRTYLVRGIHPEREGFNSVLVDVEDCDRNDSPLAVARRIVGRDSKVRFTSVMNVTEAVPSGAKRLLYRSDAALYSAVPALAPARKRRNPRRRRRYLDLED
jgi:hypothetical protein